VRAHRHPLERLDLATAIPAVRGDERHAPASLIRSLNASAENPPNTTEWNRADPAHASIAMAASGTMGGRSPPDRPGARPTA